MGSCQDRNVFLALSKKTLVDALTFLYCCVMNLCAYVHVHVIIYMVIVHSSRLYT